MDTRLEAEKLEARPELKNSPFVQEFHEAREQFMTAASAYFDAVNEPWDGESWSSSNDYAEVRDTEVSLEGTSYLSIKEERPHHESVGAELVVPYEAIVSYFEDPDADGGTPSFEVFAYRTLTTPYAETSADDTMVNSSDRKIGQLSLDPEQVSSATKYLKHFTAVIEALTGRALEERISERTMPE